MVAGALIGMALMQLVVSCTLSMLLRHVKRLPVLGNKKRKFIYIVDHFSSLFDVYKQILIPYSNFIEISNFFPFLLKNDIFFCPFQAICLSYSTPMIILISFICSPVAAFLFQACLFLVLSRWKPSQEDSALFYVIAAAWGACNGIWETILFAMISLNHINNIPQISSALQAFRFLGLGVTFIAHGFLCENVKILVLFILLVVSIVPYAMLEIRLENQRKAHVQSNSIWRKMSR